MSRLPIKDTTREDHCDYLREDPTPDIDELFAKFDTAHIVDPEGLQKPKDLTIKWKDVLNLRVKTGTQTPGAHKIDLRQPLTTKN